MRKILMNEKGEFRNDEKADYFRSTAVKMMASLIKKSDKEKDDEEVVVSKDKLIQEEK